MIALVGKGGDRGRRMHGRLVPRHGFSASRAKVRFTYFGGQATREGSISPTSVRSRGDEITHDSSIIL
jgi:hypothetical protein